MRFLLLLLCLVLGTSSAQASVLPIQEVVSPKGIKAWLVEDYNLPLVSVQFSFKGGVETDPQEKQGMAVLATNLLTQGAGRYKEKAFQEKLAKHSIQMSFSAGRDYVFGRLKMLKRKKKPAFHLLKLALKQPRFDLPVFERMRAQQKASIKFQLSSPSWQGCYALYQDVFGDHPYGYRSLGSPQTLSHIQQRDVQTFVRQHLTQDRLQVAVVGAISAKELAPILDDVFASLPKRSTLKDVPVFKWPKTQSAVHVAREGEQTNVFFIAPMLKRDDPDWYAARIANYILGGGGFLSHLMKAVRAQEGLTYGISTGLAPMDKASMLTGGFATDNAKADRAITLVHDVWQRFYEKGVSKDAVKAAQDYLTGAMALALTSTDSVASVLLSLLNEGLPLDYLDQREDYFRRVTQEDVMRVIRTWFNPAVLSTVYVGQPEDVQTQKTQMLVTE